MKDENLSYLWHQFTWAETFAGMMVFFALLVVLVIIIIAWHFRQKEANRWARLGGLAVRRQLSPEELNLLETFFASLPRQSRDLIFADTKRFWQLLYSFSRAQMRTHPTQMIRLINKLFPAARFQFAITAIEDVQPGELLACITNQNLIARVDHVDRERKRLDLAFANKSFEVTSAVSASLYFFRPGLGETRMFGSLYAAPRGHAYFQLEGDKIETSAQQRLMARLSLPVSLKPSKAPDGQTEEIALSARTELISERAFMIVFDVNNPVTSAEKKVERWLLEMVLPDSSLRLNVSGKLMPSRTGERWIFKLDPLSAGAAAILAGLVKESAPEPEKMV